LNSEIYYSHLKIDISVLICIYIWVLKIDISISEIVMWILIFYLRSDFFSLIKNHYLSQKIVIPILKIFYSNLKISIWTLKFVIQIWNCYYNSKTFYLNLKINIWIWSFKYEFLKLLVIQKYMFESKIRIRIMKIIFKN
jgi:hypothetical protein